MRAACPAHLILTDLITLGEEYRLIPDTKLFRMHVIGINGIFILCHTIVYCQLRIVSKKFDIS